MALFEWKRKTVSSCRSASVERLDEMLRGASDGVRYSLQYYVFRADPRKVCWEKVRHLRITGDGNVIKKLGFRSDSGQQGFYSSNDGSWLLVVSGMPRLEDYVTRCGAVLESLWIAVAEMTALPDLGSLTQLTALNLSRCHFLTELPGLGSLVRLTKLELSWCSSLAALPDLGSLTRLTSLSVYECNLLTVLSGIGSLAQLTKLDLSGCSALTALPNLGSLTQLNTLNLSGCSSLTELTEIGRLTQLATLDVSGCSSITNMDFSGCSSLTELTGLEELTQLNSLSLYRCNSLTELGISGCSSLTTLLGLESLTQLTKLKLSRCYSFTELPGLEKLEQLTRLDLSGCSRLKALPGLEKLEKLTSLDLSWCNQLKTLPEDIRRMKALRWLNLGYMKLQDLPDWLPDIAERFELKRTWESGKERAIVYLRDTTVESIPDMSIFEQPYEMIAEWFKNRSSGDVRPLNEIKVVFLGDGEAGKSHTIARLMNDGGEPVGYVDSSTPGIVIKDREYTSGGRTFRVHYWDFGGQEIMHSMHRIFLTGRTMYVILLNARDDTQSDRAKYWLHNVKSFAPDAPVLLVLNKIDQNPNASVDEKDLRSRYEKLTQVVRLSARDFTREQFNDSFTKILLEEIQKTGYLDAQWPNVWTKVKEQLEHMTRHYIMGDDYQRICDECKVERNRKELLRWFNDLGVSFCCDGEDDYTLKDYVILRPDWITNALYIILFNRLEGARNGLIPHKSIYRLLEASRSDPNIRCTLPDAKYTANDIGYVLGIMRKFSLSFTDGHGNEFIPMLCQQNSMADIQEHQKDADTLEFQMEFDYLPNNLLHRLMVERDTELDMTTVWRTGARFELKEPGYSALVVIDGSTLRFFIRHADSMHRPNTYLTMLKAHVERIVAKMGLKAPTCQLVYKLADGRRAEFAYDRILKLRKRGRREEYCEALDEDLLIEDILNQSAPDGLEDEKKLLEAIKKSCLNILAEPDYHLKDGENGRGLEDKRNRRIRDDLLMLGYDVNDQTQRGLSGTGRGVGELDLLLLNDRKEPWTIIEALRLSGGTKTEWDKHLDKLLENYNYFGAPCVYLLTYVDADAAGFQRIWKDYRSYIPTRDPGKFTYCAHSLEVRNDGPGNVKTAVCRYDCGGRRTTAYHIFVRIPKHGG